MIREIFVIGIFIVILCIAEGCGNGPGSSSSSGGSGSISITSNNLGSLGTSTYGNSAFTFEVYVSYDDMPGYQQYYLYAYFRDSVGNYWDYPTISSTTASSGGFWLGILPTGGVPFSAGVPPYSIEIKLQHYNNGFVTDCDKTFNNYLTFSPWAPYLTNTVTFDNQGGTPATETEYVIFPSTNVGTLPASPSKTGNYFAGWYTATNGGGYVFTAGTGVTTNTTVYTLWNNVNVYAGGYVNNAACYWINGVLTTLTNVNSQVNSLVVDGSGNAYAGGALNSYACYWKNGVFISIDNTDLSGVNSLVVDGSGNIYAGGSYYNITNHGACYWINGILTALTNVNSQVNSLAVDSSGHVFVGGYYQDTNSTNIACYWKDGVLTVLTNVDSKVNGIAVDGSGNVFACGYYRNSAKYNCPCYWKNGSLTTLDNSGYYGNASSITIDGSGNVFVCGYYGNNSYPCYWKNGKQTTFSGYIVSSIAVDGSGNVFVGGGYGSPQACYWKNGALTILDSSDSYSCVNSLVVK